MPEKFKKSSYPTHQELLPGKILREKIVGNSEKFTMSHFIF